MDMMKIKNLLIMWGCLICCMSPCMSQACIDDELNNELQCRYDCSDEVSTDRCSQFDATTHPSIDGYCCPGYFLINVTESTYICQRCRDNTFMPDINKCCGCIICMECDLTVGDSVIVDYCRSKIKNRLCMIEQDPTTPANAACPFIMTSTGNPPTTKEVNTVQVTSASDVPVLVKESKSERKPYEVGFYIVLAFLLVVLIPVLFICFFVCYAHKTAPTVEGRKDRDHDAAPANVGRNNRYHDAAPANVGRNNRDHDAAPANVGRNNRDHDAAPANVGRNNRDHDAAPANVGRHDGVTVVDTTNKGRKDGVPGAAPANEGRNDMSWKEIAQLIAKKLVRTATDERGYHPVNINEMQVNPNRMRNNENTRIEEVDEDV
ncbi:uncharacterized protein LOC135156652 [Lytechinus pictus]|uniref:uncharacterized protein LOC135156652 n=1 Tax=Lytechinus pictus TaxID=7653 RepID=UPI0030BA182B